LIKYRLKSQVLKIFLMKKKESKQMDENFAGLRKTIYPSIILFLVFLNRYYSKL